MNRLSSEITTNNDVYSYYYDDICGMPSAIVQNGQQIVSFEHNNGLLTKVIRNDIINISYDYYGNITAIGDISLGYNERNLLSSYSDISCLRFAIPAWSSHWKTPTVSFPIPKCEYCER